MDQETFSQETVNSKKTKRMKWSDEKNRVAEAIANIVFGLIGLLLINLFWDDISFLTNDFEQVLDLFNIAILISVLTNFGWLLTRDLWLWSVTKVVNSFFGIAVGLKMYNIFPFDFESGTVENLVKVVIIVGIIATGIAIVVESTKIVSIKMGDE